MLGGKEKNMVYAREKDLLQSVERDLKLLKRINPEYAKKILQIFSYPKNQGNRSYVRKIIENGEQLGIYEKSESNEKSKANHRDDLHDHTNTHINRVIKSAVNMPNIAGIFITNPIKYFLDPKEYQKFYQQLIDRTGTKDIDGQSTENKDRLKDFSQTLEGAIVHPTSLSVLSLVQKTLETTDLEGKNILFAGKDGNFGSMIATTLERAGATTIGFNPRKDDQETRYSKIQTADAVVSVIRGAHYFKKDHFQGFIGPIIDVTTEKDEETGKTVGSIDIISCNELPNTYIPSINGGVGTMTSALLMSNFTRCIINTEVAKGLNPEIFEELEEMRSYTNFGLNKIRETQTEELVG